MLSRSILVRRGYTVGGKNRNMNAVACVESASQSYRKWARTGLFSAQACVRVVVLCCVHMFLCLFMSQCAGVRVRVRVRVHVRMRAPAPEHAAVRVRL